MKTLWKLSILCLAAAVISTNGFAQAPFTQNLCYVNQHSGFRIDGPKGWYGIMQIFSPQGEPLYKFLPRSVRAFYLKYYGEEEKKHMFNPTFEVRILPKDNYESEISALKYYVRNTLDDKFLTRPALSQLGDKRWAISEYEVDVKIKNADIPLVRKLYLLIHKDSIILIQATTIKEDFGADHLKFDEAVSNSKFNDDYMKLMS